MKVPAWLKALGLALGALLAILAGREVVRRIRAALGPVEGSGAHWMPAPQDPHAILVTVPDSPQPVTVTLPEGITADQVRAVAVSEAGSATVELHHVPKDRRGMIGGGS